MLEPSVTLLEALVTNLNAGLLLEGADRRIALVNRTFLDLFGMDVPPDALTGMDCEAAVQASKGLFEDPEGFVARVHECLAARKPVTGDVLRLRDGRTFSRDYVPLFVGGEYAGHYWQYADITSTREEQQAIRGLSRFYEQVLAAMPAQLAVFDPDLRYRYITPSAVRDEAIRSWLIGRTDEEYCTYRGIDPEVGRQRMQMLAGVRDTRQMYQFEETLQTDSGPRSVVRFVSPVIDDDEQVVYILGYGLDITAQKTALHEAEAARRIAEESSKARTEFLANMSHEIRTPLNAIVGTSHLLGKETPTGNQRRYLDIIDRSAKTLLTLINSVLDMAKLASGVLELESTAMDIGGRVRGIADVIRPQAEEKGLALHVQIDPDVPDRVLGDPARMDQIVLNLLSNAVKFTDEGRITVRLDRAGDTLLLIVSDTGIGMSAEEQARIFESFVQARTDTTRRYGGTGLGLSIVRDLVKRMDGTISVDSREGHGSTFTVSIPMHPVGSDTPSPGASVAGRRALIVDDDILTATVLETLLTGWGMTVEMATGIHSLLERDDVDLLLADVDVLRANAPDQGVGARRGYPVIALVPPDESVIPSEMEACGMTYVVRKPIVIQDLARVLQQSM